MDPAVASVAVTLARPPDMVTAPSDREPSVNWTTPVAVPPDTRAVKVTDCPGREGLALLEISREELARPVKVSVTAGDVPGAKACSLAGVNAAVRRCCPAGRVKKMDAVPAEVTVTVLPGMAAPLS